MTTRPVRTRVAPSPTGDPHVGTVYQALFNYCFAKSHGGQFLLRIEDTDQVRSTKESERMIFEALRWSGIQWDEGPDIGGRCGPYRQSDRTELYQKHAKILIDKGHAYYCFCTSERLTELRLVQQRNNQKSKYDGKCRHLPPEIVAENLKQGLPAVVRMMVPSEGQCLVNDLLRGVIAIDYESVDDQVLLKSDGFPTYHLANVVDDHHMEISHIIRGEEWIPSAPKHLLLYGYFGWEAPTLCHLPLLRNPDRSKLSKRKNPTSVNYYRQVGILPEALLNYLGMMGWTMPDGQEVFSLQEMVANFDITRVSLGGPIFDITKLRWLNGKYIREKIDLDSFLTRLKDWRLNDTFLRQMLPLVKERVDTLGEVFPLAGYLFCDGIALPSEAFAKFGLETELLKEILQVTLWSLEKLRSWERDAIYGVFKGLSEQYDMKMKVFTKLFFVVFTGTEEGLPLFDSMVLLGSDLCRRRIISAMDVLGGPPAGKTLKKLEKQFADQPAE